MASLDAQALRADRAVPRRGHRQATQRVWPQQQADRVSPGQRPTGSRAEGCLSPCGGAAHARSTAGAGVRGLTVGRDLAPIGREEAGPTQTRSRPADPRHDSRSLPICGYPASSFTAVISCSRQTLSNRTTGSGLPASSERSSTWPTWSRITPSNRSSNRPYTTSCVRSRGLRDLGSRLCRQGRNGSERFRRVLDMRPEWWTAVDTDLELRLEQAIVDAGLPRPIRQFEIALPDGSDIHPDFYWPDPPTALEVDHSSWHGGREQQTYDKWRDRQLTRVGVRPMRVSEDDIRFRLETVTADLAAVLRT